MAVKIQVEALDLISQLGQEMVVAYEAEDKTVDTIVTDLLAFQLRTPAITKGTISGSYSALTRSIKVDGDTILRALYKLHSTVGGYIHVDNDRKLQWADSIGEDKGQQLRYRKNLKGIDRDINYHGLVNRLYAYGAGEGTARIKLSDAEGQDEDYIQDQNSHDTWGGWYPGILVDRSITHPDTLLAWAELRLAEIKDPIISYSVDVIDLSESNLDFGFDELQLGSIVKVIDEDLGIDVSVSIVKIKHHDLANPQDMTVELSTRIKDITDTLMEVYDIEQFRQHVATEIGAGQVIVKGPFTVLDWVTGGETTIKGSVIETGTIVLGALNFIPLTSSGATGEVIATINATSEGIKISASKIDIVAGVRTFKQAGIPTSENIGDIWFDTDDNNKAYRAACVGADEITAGEWELVRDAQISTNAAAITVNETQISLNVTDISALDGRLTTAEGEIVVNASQISINVSDISTLDGQVTTNTGNITVNADAITLEVTNRTNADSGLQGQITVNADNILLKVSSTDYNGTTIVSKINLTGGGVVIDAQHIELNGVVAVAADIKSSNYSAGSAGWIIEGNGDAEFNAVTVRGTIYASAGEFTGTLKVTNIEAGKTLTVNGTIAATNLTIDANGITFKTETKCRFFSGGTSVGTLGAQNTTDLRLTSLSGKAITIFAGQGTGKLWLWASEIETSNPIYCSTIDCGDLLPRGTTGTKMFGHTTKRWANMYGVLGNFTGTVTVGALSTSGAVNSATLVTSGNVTCGNRLNIGDGSRPVVSEAGDIGGTDKWYDKMYANTFYGKNLDIQGFQGHDDIAMLKTIRLTPKGKLDITSFPSELLESDKAIKSNLGIKKVPVGVTRGIDMAVWQSLQMGALVQLADELDELKAKVAALN